MAFNKTNNYMYADWRELGEPKCFWHTISTISQRQKDS